MHDVAGTARDLLAPHHRDDAEGAGVVAADGDRHPRRVRHLAVRRQRRRHIVDRRSLFPDLGHRAPLLGVIEQAEHPVQVVGAEDHIDPGGLRHDQVAVLLGEASADDDAQPGPLILDRLQLPEIAVEPVVGVLPDAAGVDEHHVGIVDVRRGHHPVDLEQAGDPLGVVLVHLAAEGAHQIAPPDAGRGAPLPHHGKTEPGHRA